MRDALDIGHNCSMAAGNAEQFDVFLSYSRKHGEWAEKLARQLKDAGFRVWFDKWSLVPGHNWLDGLKKGMEQSKCCVICVGGALEGWQEQEAEYAMVRQRRNKDFGVIPVVMPSGSLTVLHGFLELRHSVEYSGDPKRAFYELCCGIRGEAPGPLLSSAPDSSSVDTRSPAGAVSVNGLAIADVVAIVGVILGGIAMAVPMTWYLRALVLSLVGCGGIFVIWHSSFTINRPNWQKAAIGILYTSTLVFLGWSRFALTLLNPVGKTLMQLEIPINLKSPRRSTMRNKLRRDNLRFPSA